MSVASLTVSLSGGICLVQLLCTGLIVSEHRVSCASGSCMSTTPRRCASSRAVLGGCSEPPPPTRFSSIESNKRVSRVDVERARGRSAKGQGSPRISWRPRWWSLVCPAVRLTCRRGAQRNHGSGRSRIRRSCVVPRTIAPRWSSERQEDHSLPKGLLPRPLCRRNSSVRRRTAAPD